MKRRPANKLLVLAHTPPPHHGQSQMVQRMLGALADKPGIKVFHVNCRFSRDAADVGRARPGKVFLALKFALQAIGTRLRHGAMDLYYVPAFPSRAPVLRDWIMLGLCRPFFNRTIFHWHAVGLAQWLRESARPWERCISRHVYSKPDLSLVVRPSSREDADAFQSRRVEVVLNGIPDPCPDFAAAVLPRRLARAGARKKLLSGEILSDSERNSMGGDPEVFRILFMSLCHRGKGLFDLLDAVALARKQSGTSPLRLRLTVAGEFWKEEERAEFNRRIREPDLVEPEPVVDYRGFVSGAEKDRLLRESDCLCFPTCMPESFGLVLVEAMAHGLPLITTDWRGIPELLPAGWPGVVPPKAPAELAARLVEFTRLAPDQRLRTHFEAHYTEEVFARRIREALAGQTPPTP